MLTRSLTLKERKLIQEIETFIRDKHRHSEGHDYSHVLEVVRYSLKIAKAIEEPVNPFILICGALFHDIGRIYDEEGTLHGLIGGAITDMYLKSTWVKEEDACKIVRIVVRHTATSRIPPETVEEKIVYDADGLDRLGLMGMIRGVMGKRGSIKEILENRSRKRLLDYKRLYFDVSREIGEKLYNETLEIVAQLLNALETRLKDINDIQLP
ncbi:hypothetical protein BBF96_12015 [Anoxybacter fermentans]|uniref:HD domain-containing protein n=1 Tax=Anoxybacter fermentans TaxID=1323375 RepID=A0A3Q9HS63_9FIRM|nr:HD domain-containing protein [Anoxybacter fermentans]AZR74056.1 hypothetical protein BBF96_12015 [Anoxybacter fermentans]